MKINPLIILQTTTNLSSNTELYTSKHIRDYVKHFWLILIQYWNGKKTNTHQVLSYTTMCGFNPSGRYQWLKLPPVFKLLKENFKLCRKIACQLPTHFLNPETVPV
jgi:hypothetical protein